MICLKRNDCMNVQCRLFLDELLREEVDTVPFSKFEGVMLSTFTPSRTALKLLHVVQRER